MPAIITLLNPARRRGATKRRRGNPASLVIVNGKKRRHTMAARRRRRTTAAPSRRRRRTATNPRRRRATMATNPRRRRVNRRHRSAFALNGRRRRRSNPSRRRRRNPGVLSGATGLLGQAVTAVIGMSITNFIYNAVGAMVPGGIVGKIGIKLGIAYGLGIAARKTGFASHANMLSVGGAVSAGQDAFQYFVGGGGLLFPSAAPAPAQVAGRVAIPASMTGDDQGVSDIVQVPAGWMGMGDIVNAPAGWFQ